MYKEIEVNWFMFSNLNWMIIENISESLSYEYEWFDNIYISGKNILTNKNKNKIIKIKWVYIASSEIEMQKWKNRFYSLAVADWILKIKTKKSLAEYTSECIVSGSWEFLKSNEWYHNIIHFEISYEIIKPFFNFKFIEIEWEWEEIAKILINQVWSETSEPDIKIKFKTETQNITIQFEWKNIYINKDFKVWEELIILWWWESRVFWNTENWLIPVDYSGFIPIIYSWLNNIVIKTDWSFQYYIKVSEINKF